MSAIGREALPDVFDSSEGPRKCPGVVMRPFRMSVIGRKALSDVKCRREALPDVHNWSRGPPGCPR